MLNDIEETAQPALLTLANDVIAAVRRASGKRSALSTKKIDASALAGDLAEAFDIYRTFRADDSEPKRKKAFKSLSRLVASASRLQKAFDRDGSLSWPLLRQGAEAHLESVRAEFAEINRKLGNLRARFRTNRRQSIEIQAQISDLSKKRQHLDAVIISFDHGAKNIWFRTMTGIDAILIWDHMARELNPSAETDEDDPSETANRWLIADEIPRIYKKHFGADFKIPRNAHADGKPYGPALAFARQVCIASEVATWATSIRS